MTGNIVARRYAKALFALGQKKGEAELAAYGKDLASLAEVMGGSTDVAAVFRNPVFDSSKKKAVALGLLDKLGAGQTVKNFAALLADKDRLGALPSIAAQFGVLLDETQGVLRGTMVTAVKLPKKRQDEIKTALEAQSGKQLVLDFEADAEILGGLVLKIGDKVLDASLRAQLQALKDNIKRGE